MSHIDIYDLPACPIKDVGLLPGTSKYTGKGYENLYYRYRIDAVKTLHSEHKVSYWIVSGDNSVSQYNEPKSMQEDLLNLGIEPKKIQLDYAGFRTLDSIYRAEKAFGQTEHAIVSQHFHLARAIFIAKHRNHDVVGCVAKIPIGRIAFRKRIREIFARSKLFLDLYVINTEAKFYGKAIAFPP